MKIVIDLPEETYNFIKANSSGSAAHEAIKNGTPLPKGHGRLIDADALIVSDEECGNIPNCILCKMNVETCEHFKATIENAPTIIEAESEAIE